MKCLKTYQCPPRVNNRYLSKAYSESGRSMLEVLAMLAIAGIIGSAGVGGYTVAMKKHRANELIHEAAGRALAVSQQLAVGRKLDEIDFGGYPNNDTGHGKFSDKPIPLAGGEFFKIPITGMDQAGCEQLKVMAGGSLRRVDCKDDGNGKVTADLIYQKDLSESVGTIPEDTSGDSENPSTSGTGNSATRSYDNDREGCEENGYQYCSNNICITKEEVCETGSTLCADTYPGTSEHNTGGQAGEVDGKTCRCPNGQAFNHNDSKCIVACSGHGTLDANEDCVCQGGYTGEVCETDCSAYPNSGAGSDYTGDVVGNAADGTTECKCLTDTGWNGSKCTCEVMKWCSGVEEGCKTCDTSTGRWSIKPDGSYCPTYARLIPSNFNTSCRILLGGDNTGFCWNGECIRSADMTKEQCLTYKYLWTEQRQTSGRLTGYCYSCFYFRAISTTKDECDQCSNREMLGEWCALTTASCNALYPEGGVRDNDGECYSCSNSATFSTSKDECDRCGDLRYYDGTYCRKR